MHHHHNDTPLQAYARFFSSPMNRRAIGNIGLYSTAAIVTASIALSLIAPPPEELINPMLKLSSLSLTISYLMSEHAPQPVQDFFDQGSEWARGNLFLHSE